MMEQALPSQYCQHTSSPLRLQGRYIRKIKKFIIQIGKKMTGLSTKERAERQKWRGGVGASDSP